MKKVLFKGFNKTALFTLIFIALSFFLFGTEFLSWFYILGEYFPANDVYLIGKVGGYFCQALGMLACSICVAKLPREFICSRYIPVSVIAAELLSVSAVFFLDKPVLIVVLGYFFNIVCGIHFGIYITMLAAGISLQSRGIVMGAGTALGSVGSWIVSGFAGSDFLRNRNVLIVYASFTALGIILLMLTKLRVIPERDGLTDHIKRNASAYRNMKKTVILLGSIVFLFGMINDLSNSFPTGDAIGGAFPVELARLFHAAGLIIAGILSDINRKSGAISCLILLIVPFVLFALRDYGKSEFITISIFYLIGAFYSVFRVLSFADLADEGAEYLFVAGGGLICGRLGECAGAAINTYFCNNMLILVTSAGILFVLSVILFVIWQSKKDEIRIKRAAGIEIVSESKEDLPDKEDFARKYNISAREMEVFDLILEGCSNSEISRRLYISENTVKFHIKNILRKTGSANRIELSALYNGGIVKNYK